MKPRPLRRKLLWLVAIVLGGYFAILLVLTFFENRLVYFPVRASEGWDPPPNDRVQDVTLHSSDGTRLHAWWCLPPGWDTTKGAVLCCHGNGGNLSYFGSEVLDWQRATGWAVLVFDYPGYGKSEGKPSEKGCYAAGEAAYDWLVEERGVPAERVVLYGLSLGGGVATHLAVGRPHRALVLVGTFTSLPDVGQQLYPWLPVRWLMSNRYDNRSRIGDCTRPVFIAHGTADELIPFAQAEALFVAANEPKHLQPLPGAGHNSPLGPSFFQALRDFLARAEAP